MYLSTNIQQWPIDRLTPYARNARTHSAEQVAQVAASIREFGFTNPILIDSDSGVIAGHARLQAARKLSLTEVPVIVLDHLTAAQKRAYILVDNRLALNAGWDDELLAAELATLREEEFDINLLGFDDEELDRLRNELDSPLDADENAAPEVEENAVSRPGDLWILGPHRVLCGDACSRADLDRVLDGQPADMVFTDPPYNVDYAPEDAQGRERRIANDNLGEDFPEFLRQFCTHLVAWSNGAIYIAMSSSELHTLKQAFSAAGGHWSTFLIWAKDRFTLGFSDYQRQYEPILYGPRRRLEHRASIYEQAAPDHEAGGVGRESHHQQQPPGRNGARCVWRLGHHPDRVREDRTERTADRARSEVCGRDREALAGSGSQASGAGSGWTNLRGDRGGEVGCGGLMRNEAQGREERPCVWDRLG